MDIERFFMLTNPIFWLFYLLSWLLTAIIWFWDNVLWNRKRFYWHIYDYFSAKREIQKGLTKQGLKNVKAWLALEEKRNIKHRYLKELKSLVIEAEIKSKQNV